MYLYVTQIIILLKLVLTLLETQQTIIRETQNPISKLTRTKSLDEYCGQINGEFKVANHSQKFILLYFWNIYIVHY
jgi:hypothetical protein